MQKNHAMIVKILIVAALGALLLISAVAEGYIDYLHGYVIVFFSAVLASCITTACVVSLRHLVGLILFGFAIGFVTQAIGVTSDMWCYDHTFMFAALSWSLAAITMEGISKVIRFALKTVMDNPLNVLTILAICAVMLITLALQDHWKYATHRPIPREWVEKDEFRTQKIEGHAQCFIYQTMPEEGSGEFQDTFEPNVPFWIYYSALLALAIVMQYGISFTELLSLILAAWIMGGIAEWIGATANLWHFRTETLPPLFLILGCWPLEFLVIRGLAARVNDAERG
jgi:hypothetical protein